MGVLKQMSQWLLSACVDGSPAVVERLLRTDCDAACSIDVPAPDGTTPLLATIMWGHFDALCVLLEVGADANMPFDGTRWSPLHAAAVQESPKMCQILLERGADPMLEDEHQRRPVDYASAASEEVWSHFEERGCERSSKEELVAKSIIKKVPQEERAEMAHSSKVAVDSKPSAVDSKPSAVESKPSAVESKPTSSPVALQVRNKREGEVRSAALEHYSRPGSSYAKYNKGTGAMPPPPPTRAGRPLAHGQHTRTVRGQSRGTGGMEVVGRKQSGEVNIMTLA